MSEVFGIHAVQAVLEEAPGRVRTVLVLKGRQDKRLQKLVTLARDARVRVDFVDKRRLDRLAGGAHQGVVASCQDLEPLRERELEALWETLAVPRLLLVLDGVEDPRNLGACLRSAAAAGAQAVLLPRSRSAPLSAAALKTAAGGAERLHLIEVANLARRLDWLQAQGVWIVGAAGEAERAWTAASMTGDLAIVLGSEQSGLRALTARRCDELVRIPMAGGMESLNVSVAAGVLLFEAVRQRLASGP